MSRRGNGSIVGKRIRPSLGAASGVWSVKEQNYLSLATPNAKWPIISQATKFAGDYVAATGGNIVSTNATATPDLTATLAILNPGDALLLAPGSYTSGTFSVGDSAATGGSSIYNVPFLLCGMSDNPNDVIVEVDNDSPVAHRDHPVFSQRFTSNNNYQQLAYLTYKRIQTSGTNYINSLLRPYTEGGSDWGGYAFRVYFDINGGDVSWIYDPSGTTTGNIYWRNCTFANYTNWDNRFSGSTSINRVTECVFQSTYDTDDAQFIDNNYASVTITNQTYDLNTYPAGHLFDTYVAPFTTF